MEKHLIRRYELIDSKQKDYFVKEILIKENQKITSGTPICIIANEIKNKDGEIKITIKTLTYNNTKYDEVTISKINFKIGQSLNRSTNLIFEYIIEPSIANILEDTLKSLVKKESNLYYKSEIPNKKVKNAILKYANNVNEDKVQFLYDNTFLGNGEEGFLITDSSFYLHHNNIPYLFKFNEITNWSKTYETIEINAKTIVEDFLLIETLNNEQIKIPHKIPIMNWADIYKLFEVISSLREKGIFSDGDGYAATLITEKVSKTDLSENISSISFSGMVTKGIESSRGLLRNVEKEVLQNKFLDITVQYTQKMQELKDIINPYIENDKELLILFSMGIACANADGTIETEEKKVICDMVQGLTSLHPKLEKKFNEMINTPNDSVDTLYKIYSEINNFDDEKKEQILNKLSKIIKAVISTDGIINEREENFILHYEKLFNVNLDLVEKEKKSLLN